MISLGKGFFEFIFESVEDLRSLRSIGSWNLNPGVLRLFAWIKDFNPAFTKQTNFQCWVKIHGLSREYWRNMILFEIGGAFGVPIALDEATRKRSFGYYARILIDIDLTSVLWEKILVEREGFAFCVDVKYEWLPPFCSYCQVIGHPLEFCRQCNTKAAILNRSSRDVYNIGNKKGNVQYVPKWNKEIAQDKKLWQGNSINEKKSCNFVMKGNSIMAEGVAEVTHCKQADVDFRSHEEICSESGGVMDYEEDRSRPKRRRHPVS